MRRTAVVACLAALFQIPSAHALTFVSQATNGNTVDLAFATADTIAADIGFVASGSVTITWQLDPEDVVRGAAAFNSIVDNFSATPFGALTVHVDGGAITPGGFASNDGAMVVTAQDARSVSFAFSPAMATHAWLGDPFLSGGTPDWSISLAGLGAGDTLSITMTTAVPEPGTWAMLAGGLGLLALNAGRRRGR